MSSILLSGPAGAGKSQEAKRLRDSMPGPAVVADFQSLVVALLQHERGPDGKYPLRPDWVLPLAEHLRRTTIDAARAREVDVIATNSDGDKGRRQRLLERLGPGAVERVIDPGKQWSRRGCLTLSPGWFRRRARVQSIDGMGGADELETRQAEIRLEQDAERLGPGRLVGVLLPYGQRAADRPEMFEAGALHWPSDGVLLRAMHRRDSPVARFTPEATEAEVRASIPLPDTTAGRDAAANVRAGVLKGLSVEFHSERETRRDGLRVIQRARLVGAGLVDSGAYAGATVEARGEKVRRRLWL